MKNKVILTDCDGVLLDWEYAFDQWMHRHGYTRDKNAEISYNVSERYGLSDPAAKSLVRMFNESAAIRKVPPLRDAIKYVKKLHEEYGYVFHCITAMTDDEYAQSLRIKNLIEMFGATVFEKYVFVECGGDKDEALEPYRDTGCWWVEDKYKNYLLGESLGLESVLFEHDYNEMHEAFSVKNWKEFYNIIAT